MNALAGRFLLVTTAVMSIAVPDGVRANHLLAEDILGKSPHVAACADGGFVAIWSRERPKEMKGRFYSKTIEVHLQIHDRTGSPVGSSIVANEDSRGHPLSPAVVHVGDGRFLVSWVESPQPDEPQGVIVVRQFDLAGRTFGTTGTLSPPTIRAGPPRFLADPLHRVLLLYPFSRTQVREQKIACLLLDNAGKPLSRTAVLATGNSHSVSLASNCGPGLWSVAGFNAASSISLQDLAGNGELMVRPRVFDGKSEGVKGTGFPLCSYVSQTGGFAHLWHQPGSSGVTSTLTTKKLSGGRTLTTESSFFSLQDLRSAQTAVTLTDQAGKTLWSRELNEINDSQLRSNVLHFGSGGSLIVLYAEDGSKPEGGRQNLRFMCYANIFDPMSVMTRFAEASWPVDGLPRNVTAVFLYPKDGGDADAVATSCLLGKKTYVNRLPLVWKEVPATRRIK